MPFIALLIAVVLIVAGLRGNTAKLGQLLAADFTGTNSFGKWIFAIFVIGAIGYAPKLKALSDAFLGLVILVILIANDQNGNGFFTNLTSALNSVGATSGQFAGGPATATTLPNTGAANSLANALPQLSSLTGPNQSTQSGLTPATNTLLGPLPQTGLGAGL